MTFRFPSSPSEPPSTPDSRRNTNFLSTTPAGPPPSSSNRFSFNHHPSNGSSRGPSNAGSLFKQPPTNSNLGSTFAHQTTSKRRPFHVPSSPPRDFLDDSRMDDPSDILANISPGIQSLQSSFRQSIRDSPRSVKRQRLQQSTASNTVSKLDVRGYARGYAAAQSPPRLNEPDDLVFQTEVILGELDESITDANDMTTQTAINTTVSELSKLWHARHPLSRDEIESTEVTPDKKQPPSTSASLLATLILPLHHPASWQRKDAKKLRTSQSLVLHNSSEPTIPEILLGWLDTYHDPGAEIVDAVFGFKRRGGYAASDEFWDGLCSTILRGHFDQALTLLRGANFRGQSDQFTGPQVTFIENAIEIMIEVLEQCPAVKSADWNIKGESWSIFRHQLKTAKEDLQHLLRNEDDEQLGQSQLHFSLSQSIQRVKSSLPTEIFDYLSDICDILLGDPTAIIKSAYDWVESVFAITVWWDGDEFTDDFNGQFSTSRQRVRPVDVTPSLAYRQRLSQALALTLEEDDLLQSIDKTNPFVLALCCVFEGDLEGFFGLFKQFSIVIASATAQIASLGGWLLESKLRGFDKSDLMVLSFGEHQLKSTIKDDILATYATLLAQRELITDSDGRRQIPGWHLALTVLGRLDNPQRANSSVTTILDGIEIQDSSRLDHLIELLTSLGFSQQAMQLSEKFADKLTDAGKTYGDALLYYAKAHKPLKLKEVLHKLITLSVINSTAYPPASQLDERLQGFLDSPEQAIALLDSDDIEAGQFLMTYLSGYATIRAFYNLRDEQLNGDAIHRPIEQKQLAARQLLTLILSAADPIRGGLFDPEVDVVVPVDVLLVLLGEALAFLNQPTRVFSVKNLASLLRSIEDLESVGNRVLDRCSAALAVTIAASKGLDASSQHRVLGKSISNVSNISGTYSFIGSSINSLDNGLTSTEGSGVLVSGPVNRSWDWRDGLTEQTTADKLLRILRLSIAKELASVWVVDSDLGLARFESF